MRKKWVGRLTLVVIGVGGNGTDGIGVVSKEEVGGTERTEIQTDVGGCGTAKTVLVFYIRYRTVVLIKQRYILGSKWVGRK